MSETTKHSVQTLRPWLADRVATYVQRPVDEIQTDIPLAEYGLSSVYALTLTGEIEDHLGVVVDPTVMWDHPTIDALAEALLVALGDPSAAARAAG
ncbi:MAG TPA: acyl carrier protein [Kofleriaceae bacterium]|nr:acyl carrier protein [Kofleriaceae bacterium]